VTQHGSFPDRPRGRRARHGSDPQWQSPSGEGGPGSVPPDDREFPDLEPIRGRRLSDSDNRPLPGDGGLPGRGAGRHGRHGVPDAFDSGSQQQYGQYGQQYDQQAGAQRFGEQPGGQYGGRPTAGQPPRPSAQFADQQYTAPRKGSRSRGKPAASPTQASRTPASRAGAGSTAGSDPRPGWRWVAAAGRDHSWPKIPMRSPTTRWRRSLSAGSGGEPRGRKAAGRADG